MAATAAATALSVFAAGACDQSEPQDSPRAGRDAAPDSSLRETGTDAVEAEVDGDMGPSSACSTPTDGSVVLAPGATQVLQTAAQAGLFGAQFCSVKILGLTEDGAYALFSGTSAFGTAVYAIALRGDAGGSYAQFVPSSSNWPGGLGGYVGYPAILIVHDAVFGWTVSPTGQDAGPIVGVLNAIANETPGTSFPMVATSIVGLAWASADSQKVAFTADVAADGGTGGELVLANTDLSGSVILPMDSLPQMQSYAGFVDDGHFVAAYLATVDGGAQQVVSSWDTVDGSRTDLLTNVQIQQEGPAWAVTTAAGPDAGPTIVALTATGQLDAVPLSGGPPTTIDVNVTSFALTPAGDGVLYGTTGQGFNLAPLPTGNPIVILPGGSFGGLVYGPRGVAVSPDGNWSVFHTAMSHPPGPYDLNLVQNVATATATPFTTAGGFLGDAFTADMSYVVYGTDLHAVPGLGVAGSLSAFTVSAGGGEGEPISSHEVTSVSAMTGKTIVYSDDLQSLPGTTGLFGADLSIVDLSSSPLAPKPIVKQADPGWFVSTDTGQLVFAVNSGNATTNGIYVYPLQSCAANDAGRLACSNGGALGPVLSEQCNTCIANSCCGIWCACAAESTSDDAGATSGCLPFAGCVIDCMLGDADAGVPPAPGDQQVCSWECSRSSSYSVQQQQVGNELVGCLGANCNTATTCVSN